MASTFVKDIMKKDVITIDHTMTAKDAAKIMAQSEIGCIVITTDKIPVGILTERDYVRRIAASSIEIDPLLCEVMSSPLITINQEDSVWDAADVMRRKKIHRLPVKDGDSLVGIVTATDIVKICSFGSDSNMREICDQILLRMQLVDDRN